ncbi:MAG TPA: DUF5916 domain-containing protein, partial [Planctomycetota bacterium]|nr:DUF5916 domain-containing protein [Planctomycetota bacterium]
LDDPVWKLARPSDVFVQVEPREGEAPSERTEIRALFDADCLYLAVRCFDRDAAAIIATQMRRDADLDTDDRVLIVLDTFEDHRNGYLFEMNPAGARVDALIGSNGRDVNQAWDAIWQGRASIDGDGWSLEFAIPYKSLSFSPGLTSWGFNVQRVIKRRLENDRWASPRRNLSVLQVSEAGTLAGLREIRQGIGLDVVPFFVARWNAEESGHSALTGQPGFDAFYHLTPGLGAALTVNTDFAETEVDQHRVNLTRFPLFFPEKRDFFLQDAGLFQFAELEDDLIPFFSRRIGLTTTGDEVPIEVGGKLTGRTGDYGIGLLGAHTGATDQVDPADLFVARVSRNFGEQSSIGTIFTAGDPNGRDENAVAGVDVNLGTSSFLGDRNLRASIWALESFTEPGDDAAFGASLSYPNDVWSWKVQAKEIGSGFHPALGFVPRTGVRTYSGEVGFEPIINRAVRRLEFALETLVVTDLGNHVETASAPLQFLGIVWDAGDEFRMKVIPSYESLDQPFGIHDGVTIAAGDYDWLRWRVETESALKRPVSGAVAVEAGDFFDGTRTDIAAQLSWRPSRYFTGGLGYEQNLVDLPGGRFVVHQGTLRCNFALSPDLSWSNFVQLDNESDTLGWNSRLQWIVRPGTELNCVFDDTVAHDNGRLVTVSQGAAVKLQYTIRF